MNKFFKANLLAVCFFSFTLLFANVCSAKIETAVEPFTGEKTYTSKYMFSDSQRNMHSIALVKSIKPLAGGKTETQTYFLLNFSMPRGATLGDAMDIQVTPRHVNSLPLAPYLSKGFGYSSVPTARTGHKNLPDMTVVAIEKGEELLVRVNFSPKGHALYTIPAEVVAEWAKLLQETDEDNKK